MEEVDQHVEIISQLSVCFSFAIGARLSLSVTLNFQALILQKTVSHPPLLVDGGVTDDSVPLKLPRLDLGCTGGIPHEGAPLKVFVASLPGQEVQAVDESRRLVICRGPEKGPRAVSQDPPPGEAYACLAPNPVMREMSIPG